MLKARIEERYDVVTASLDGLLAKLEKEVMKKSFLKVFSTQDNVDEEVAHKAGKDADELTNQEFLQYAQDILQDNWDDFSYAFRQKAKESNGRLMGWRCMTFDEKTLKKFLTSVKKGKYLKGFSGIGKWFSWSEDAAECHWGHKAGHNLVVTVVAEIPYSSIDVGGMAWANMHYSIGADEKEITLKAGAKLFVTAILDNDGKNLLGDDIKSLPAVAET